MASFAAEEAAFLSSSNSVYKSSIVCCWLETISRSAEHSFSIRIRGFEKKSNPGIKNRFLSSNSSYFLLTDLIQDSEDEPAIKEQLQPQIQHFTKSLDGEAWAESTCKSIDQLSFKIKYFHAKTIPNSHKNQSESLFL
jgi:hypothetical protein